MENGRDGSQVYAPFAGASGGLRGKRGVARSAEGQCDNLADTELGTAENVS